MARSQLALRPAHPVGGPPCPGCGAILIVTDIQPTADKPDCDLLTFECAWFEHSHFASAERKYVGLCPLYP